MSLKFVDCDKKSFKNLESDSIDQNMYRNFRYS